MFDFVRKHMKIMQFMLFLLIVPSFVLFGLDGYNRFRQNSPTVARVAGLDVTQADWDAAHKGEIERVKASMPSVDVKLLDSPQARYAVLERLVSERMLAVAADKLKLMTSDTRLARELQQDPSIAALRKSDGTLDMERYRQLLATQGMTPEGFEAQARSRLSLRQVQTGVTQSAFTPQAVADVGLGAFFERRQIQVARFSAQDYSGKVTPDDAALQAYYKKNEAKFQAPEQADIEYVVLDPESIKASITLGEQEIKAYYEQNASRFSSPEERRASHILISVPKTANAGERQKARARIDTLLAEIRKTPGSFPELARKSSQDTGSAAAGGDLGFFGRGAMVKPFEDAAFALKKGESSDVVESEFGFHIILLTDIKASKIRTYEEMKDQLRSELTKQQAQRKFAEIADTFTNGVYEQADSLKPVADQLKLEIRTATNLTRMPAPGATGVLANPKFLAAIFAPESVEKKRNTEAVETAANQLVAGRVTRYTPTRTRSFSEVESVVRASVVEELAADLARKDGQAKLAAWKQEPGRSMLPEAVVVGRDQTQAFPPAVIDAVMRADRANIPGFVGVDLGIQGYAVVKVNKVEPRGTVLEAARQQNLDQYNQLWSAAEAQAYGNALKSLFKVEILVPKPSEKPTGPVGPGVT